MRRITKTLAKLDAVDKDIPILELRRMLDSAIGGRHDDSVADSNMRVRIQSDEVYLPWDEHESTVYHVSILSEEVMTPQEIEEERLFLDMRKAEREAADRVHFDRLKKHYGWC